MFAGRRFRPAHAQHVAVGVVEIETANPCGEAPRVICRKPSPQPVGGEQEMMHGAFVKDFLRHRCYGRMRCAMASISSYVIGHGFFGGEEKNVFTRLSVVAA